MTIKPRLMSVTALAATTAMIAVATSPAASARTATTGTDASSTAAVTASVVRGDCRGGGSIVLRVEARGDKYLMTASAAHLPVDGRWRGSFYEGSSRAGEYIEPTFKTTVVDGAFSVSRKLRALDEPEFGLIAFKRVSAEGDPGGSCVVFLKPASPFAGLTWCYRPYQLILTASQRAGGRLVVRYKAGGRLEAGTRWNVTVQAVEADSGSSVQQEDTVGPRGALRGRLTFAGVTNPRLRLTVSNTSGDSCTVAIRRTIDPSRAGALERLERHSSPAATTRALHELLAAHRPYVDPR